MSWMEVYILKKFAVLRKTSSFVRRQQIPDALVFRPQHPRAESLQSAFLDQRVALAKSARVSEKDPFAHICPIKIEPGCSICGIPFDMPAISLREIECVVRADIFGGRIWHIAGFVV